MYHPATSRIVCCDFIALAACLIAAGRLEAGVPRSSTWLTGLNFEKALAQPTLVAWSNNPLREALRNLGDTHRIAVFVDRRVDPGRPLTLSLQNVPLEAVFDNVAQQLGLGVTYFESVVYLGPQAHTSRLRTLAELCAEERRKLPAAARRTFSMPHRFSWSDFDTPRELLQRLSNLAGIEIIGQEQVPHDLWAGAELPRMNIANLLTLVLGQFDLTYEFEAGGRSISLVPVPENPAIVRNYPGGRQADRIAQDWSARFPEAEITVRGSTVWVRALLEVHERIAGRKRPSERFSPQTGGPEARYTIRELKDVPVGPTLEQLGRQLGFQVSFDQQAIQTAGISLDQRITVTVQDATVEEIFQQVGGAAGLAARRVGKTIEIKPRK
jgi:hypothetical protein